MVGLTMCNLTLPLVTEDEALGVAAALGFAGVDFIDVVDAGTSHVGIPYDDPVAAGRVAARVAASYRDAGLPMTDFYPVTPDTPDADLAPINAPDAAARARARAWFERVLAFACEAGAGGLTITPGIEWEGEDLRTSLRRSVDELAWRLARAGEAGMTLSVEPVMLSLMRVPSVALALLEEMPELTLTLDYSHYVQAGYDDAEIEPLLARARHLHCRGAAKGRIQTPLRSSTIDYDRVVALLTAQGYDGYLCCECFPPEPFGLDEIDVWPETIELRNLLRDALARHGATVR